MSESNLDAIYAQIESLPSLPTIVSNVLEITDAPESSAEDLMKAVLPDQSMCATILKIANSAFFGLPREVSTLEKAVMVLGFDEIKNIVLGKAVFNSFKELNSENKKIIEEFWNHSFICGLTAKILAERNGLSASEFFVAGLIHDIGKLPMLITFPTIYSHQLRGTIDNWAQSYNQEKELFFICHDEIGKKMLQRWFFPEKLVAAVGFHHKPKNAEEIVLAASIIQVADFVSHIYTWGEQINITDFPTFLLHHHHDIFELWSTLGLDHSRDEINKWFLLLRESIESDSGILNIFSS